MLVFVWPSSIVKPVSILIVIIPVLVVLISLFISRVVLVTSVVARKPIRKVLEAHQKTQMILQVKEVLEMADEDHETTGVKEGGLDLQEGMGHWDPWDPLALEDFWGGMD